MVSTRAFRQMIQRVDDYLIDDYLISMSFICFLSFSVCFLPLKIEFRWTVNIWQGNNYRL